MDLTTINEAIEDAFDIALDAMPTPERVEASDIGENVSLATETYTTPDESGFVVVCTLRFPEVNFSITRCKQHGPSAFMERDWPAEGIEAAVQGHVARCIAVGEAHVRRAGFNADRKVILLNKLLKAKEADALASVPKLVALYGWMEATQAAAVSGQTGFAAAPYSFEEVVTE